MEDYPKRRHAVIHLGIRDIAALVDLPEGARIHHTFASNPAVGGIGIVLESEDFDEVEWDAEPPYHYGLSRVAATDDETGVVYHRWTVK